MILTLSTQMQSGNFQLQTWALNEAQFDQDIFFFGWPGQLYTLICLWVSLQFSEQYREPQLLFDNPKFVLASQIKVLIDRQISY